MKNIKLLPLSLLSGFFVCYAMQQEDQDISQSSSRKEQQLSFVNIASPRVSQRLDRSPLLGNAGPVTPEASYFLNSYAEPTSPITQWTITMEEATGVKYGIGRSKSTPELSADEQRRLNFTLIAKSLQAADNQDDKKAVKKIILRTVLANVEESMAKTTEVIVRESYKTRLAGGVAAILLALWGFATPILAQYLNDTLCKSDQE